MELKPGYKQTEVGVIPEDWAPSRVADLGRVVTGGTPRTDIRSFWNGHIPWVTPTDIIGSRDMWSSERGLTQKGLEAIRGLPGGSVLVTCIASIGKNAILKVEGGCNQQINAVVPNRNYNAEFLYYLFEASKQYLLANAGMTATSILSKAAFQELRFAVPPLPEQHAIAGTLVDVDALLGALTQLIAKKRDLKQAAMQQLLTGQTRLPGFSGAWETTFFGNVFSRVNAKENQIQTSEYQVTGAFPVVDQGKEPVVGFSDRADKRFRCPQGGVIIFGDHTCIVKFVEFDFVVGADGTQILATKTGHCARFHAFQLQLREIPTTGYNRHFKFLKEQLFVAPSLPEQTVIAAVLSDMDAELTALEQRLAKTRALKQGMMQELLTGRTRLV